VEGWRPSAAGIAGTLGEEVEPAAVGDWERASVLLEE
jgi:hypothetical protein